MTTERWRKRGLVPLTKEYCAGIIAGTGLGLLLGRLWSILFPSEVAWDFARVVAFFCIAAGGLWVTAIHKRTQKDKAEIEAGISN